MTRIDGKPRRSTSLVIVALIAVAGFDLSAQDRQVATSPDGRNAISLLVEDGTLYYTVTRDGDPIILRSRLGFEFRRMAPFGDSVRVMDVSRQARDTTWTQVWGEVAQVRDHHNEVALTVRETGGDQRSLVVRARAFDDGVAFRYEFPEQDAFASFEIMGERTEFHLADDARAWWIPAGEWNRYEFIYSVAPVSRLPVVHTPLTMEMSDGTHVVIHEADLFDYAAMNLVGGQPLGPSPGDRVLNVDLAAWADGSKVKGSAPFRSPWRTIELSDDAAGLVPSVMGLNLNPPSVIEDTDWIMPQRYIGIWWGMHIGTMTWHSGARHGATTANTRRYIDFAADNGFDGVLVEGWNTGWDGDWMANAEVFSFTEPYPDYDLPGLADYARQRGVSLIAHNETSMGIENYEEQIPEAYRLYESLGINAIKSGYVGDSSRSGHAHHGQYMVRHWRRVLELAAWHRIMMNVHEPIKGTGEWRTYPNMVTREGARGQEYNAWGGEGGNPPEHETILFFTRMLSGPMDFTPGVFDVQIASANGTPRGPTESRIRTTVAKQLALYVVLYSPMQMAADLIENLDGHPALPFVQNVALDWGQTQVLEGMIGDYVVVARRARGSDEWFLGAITDEEARTFDVPLSFLADGVEYVAEIYADGADAHWQTNPTPLDIVERRVNELDRLTVRLAAGGGQAIRFRPVR